MAMSFVLANTPTEVCTHKYHHVSVAQKLLLALLLNLICSLVYGQRAIIAPVDSTQVKLLSLKPSPAFDKRRFWACAGTGAALYTGASIAMWHAWYSDYPRSGFHTFNDFNEWRGMDKAGHLQAAYVQSYYSFKGAQWTGMNSKKAMWTGAGIAFGLQATVEVMDGFSEEWGFSIGDMAFNTIGIGLFVAQEVAWKEQRIILKVSSSQPNYSSDLINSIDGLAQTSLKMRAEELYGSTPSEVFLKDYNAMTIWASFNIKSFCLNSQNKIPGWLNLSVGMGAENIYGGFENRWTDERGAVFELENNVFDRYQQLYISPDIDLSRIPTRHRWLKLVLSVLNWIKVPAPAMEVNTKGDILFHPFYW